jgi:hypothetical protein
VPGTTGHVDPRRGSLYPSEPSRCVVVTQRSLERLGNQLGSPAHQTGKNLGLNNRPAFKRQKGYLINSWRHPNNYLLG